MIRLIQSGLMFGNLVHISSPALVERYNRALQHLASKTTALTDFHIDISGYSPEIGDELGDPLYLNPNGVNRQFILLTPEQKRAPLLNVKFSTSRPILREFIEANEAQLFALTATDAVAGELVNSVFKLRSPADLFTLRKIEIEADTVGGTLKNADKLAAMIERFKTETQARDAGAGRAEAASSEIQNRPSRSLPASCTIHSAIDCGLGITGRSLRQKDFRERAVWRPVSMASTW